MRTGLELLPASVRLRARAGVRTGRYLFSAGIAAAVVMVCAIQSRWGLHGAREILVAVRGEADEVVRMEERIAALETSLESTREFRSRYEAIAHPLEISRVVATLVNAMPDGMTLDRIDLEAGAKRAARSARDRGRTAVAGERPPRVLAVELAGFAPDDAAVAEFLARLGATEPFRDVTLDYSRTRSVRERPAREFRLTIKADLEQRYVDAGEEGP